MIIRSETSPVYGAEYLMVAKIVSGGQTGADRGGLEAAMSVGLPCGGWCPKGRLAEDGEIPARYPLDEMDSKAYIRRTEQNVVDSDATLVFTYGPPTGGSARTVEFAEKHGRPCLHVDLRLDDSAAAAQVSKWLRSLGRNGLVINVAGSRGSKNPDIAGRVATIVKSVLREVDGIGWEPEWFPRPILRSAKGGRPALLLPFVGSLAAGWPFDGFEAHSLAATDMWVRIPAEAMGPGRYVVEVAGDSMEPTLRRGEHIVVEWHRTPRRTGQIVVMCRAVPGEETAEVAIKRFDQTPSHWVFRSDNPGHAPVEVPKTDQPRYPILGIAVYNLTRREPIR